jgi:hypothetical protein
MFEVYWGLVDKISPAFELKIPRCAGGHQVIPAASQPQRFDGQLSRVYIKSRHALVLLLLGSPLKQHWQPLQVFNNQKI